MLDAREPRSFWADHRFGIETLDRFADQMREDPALARRFLADQPFADRMTEELFLVPAVRREFDVGSPKHAVLASSLACVARAAVGDPAPLDSEAPRSRILAGRNKASASSATGSATPPATAPSARAVPARAATAAEPVAASPSGTAPASPVGNSFRRWEAAIYGDRVFASSFATDAAVRAAIVAKAWADPAAREVHASAADLECTWKFAALQRRSVSPASRPSR